RRMYIAILRYCYGDERYGEQERQASFVPPLLPRRHKFRIARFCASTKARSLHCSSSPHKSFTLAGSPNNVIAKGVGKLYCLHIPQRLSLELVGQVGNAVRSEERRVGKQCRRSWAVGSEQEH